VALFWHFEPSIPLKQPKTPQILNQNYAKTTGSKDLEPMQDHLFSAISTSDGWLVFGSLAKFLHFLHSCSLFTRTHQMERNSRGLSGSLVGSLRCYLAMTTPKNTFSAVATWFPVLASPLNPRQNRYADWTEETFVNVVVRKGTSSIRSWHLKASFAEDSLVVNAGNSMHLA